MLRVKVRSNASSETVIVNSDATIREVFTGADLELTPRAILTLDGTPIMGDDLDRTFAEYGAVDGTHQLSLVAKMDNA